MGAELSWGYLKVDDMCMGAKTTRGGVEGSLEVHAALVCWT
jgi:hypothetical protein